MIRLALVLLAALPLVAQPKRLTFEAIYDPEKKVNYSGSVQSGFEWIDERTFVWPKKNDSGLFAGWTRFDAITGKEQPLFEPRRMQRALEAAGVDSKLAAEASAAEEMKFDPAKTSAVVQVAGDLWLYEIERDNATRLTRADGVEEEPAFSPDGRRVAFVRANDLYVVDLKGRERRITSDGSPRILNGKLDWLYQEEIYGRGKWRGYWWSPASTHLAFLRLDETNVPHYTIVDDIPYRPSVEVYPYPKAGDPNPGVSLRIASVDEGEPVAVDDPRLGNEVLIVDVSWDRHGRRVAYQLQDREQRWLELRSAALDGRSRTILRETTSAWVEPLGAPLWLRDGSFLWQSERSGFRHIYRYSTDGSLLRRITSGAWEVRDLLGVDEKNGVVWFAGTERSPIGLDLYRVRLDGSGLKRVSEAPGTHYATFNPSYSMYVDRWSDIRTPDQAWVHRGDGTLVQIVDINTVEGLRELVMPEPEFLQVKARDGFVMEAMILRPRGFDPAKKYPVYQFLYGGPHSQQVTNRWRGQSMLFNRLVADQGAIVWICDNRTSSGKGAASAWPVHRGLGELELRDVLDALDWLSAQPGVDGSRVLLHGWSYGGFMVTYAMTHSDRFAAGIAGAPVTDWRDYDSVYTERHLLLPKDNEDGYRRSSPRFAAKNLRGNLLLLHGTIDDNVHLQNTSQFAHELQKEGKPFEMMLLPRTRHSVTDKQTLAFMQKTVLDFVRRQLGLP